MATFFTTVTFGALYFSLEQLGADRPGWRLLVLALAIACVVLFTLGIPRLPRAKAKVIAYALLPSLIAIPVLVDVAQADDSTLAADKFHVPYVTRDMRIPGTGFYLGQPNYGPKELATLDAAAHAGQFTEWLVENDAAPIGDSQVRLTIMSDLDRDTIVSDLSVEASCRGFDAGSVFRPYTQGGGGPGERPVMFFDLDKAEPYPQVVTMEDHSHWEVRERNYFDFRELKIPAQGSLPLLVILHTEEALCDVDLVAHLTDGQDSLQLTLASTVRVAGEPPSDLPVYWDGPDDMIAQTYPGWRIRETDEG